MAARLAAERRAWEAEQQLASQKRAAGAHAHEVSRLRSALADAEAAVGAKSRLMSVMCHEVRTPLNGCLACAEMLLETPLQVSRQRMGALAETLGASAGVALGLAAAWDRG
jgi:signal transduction histidine kinase